MHVYGITNCSTVKKSLEWLKGNKHEFEFHDFKKKGITREKLQEWCNKASWENLLNKRGTTWRKLPAEQQEAVTNENAAIELMLDKPSVIKRPVIEFKEKIFLGFDEEQYATFSN